MLLAILGYVLANRALDPLSWYGAEYPFEVCMSTFFTAAMRKATQRGFVGLYSRTGWTCLEPFVSFGKYSPEPSGFRCAWFAAQLLQAVVLISLPARIASITIMLTSLQLLPASVSPMLLVGEAWYNSPLTCFERTVGILYIMPVIGDAVQFIIIDSVQKFRLEAGSEPTLH